MDLQASKRANKRTSEQASERARKEKVSSKQAPLTQQKQQKAKQQRESSCMIHKVTELIMAKVHMISKTHMINRVFAVIPGRKQDPQELICFFYLQRCSSSLCSALLCAFCFAFCFFLGACGVCWTPLPRFLARLFACSLALCSLLACSLC